MALVAVAVALGALVLYGTHRPAQPEAVHGAILGPGESITATNKFGTVTVSYVSPVERRFAWDRHSQVIKMIVRGEPFMGRSGLYDPAERWFFDPRRRLIVQESVMNLATYEEAYALLYQGSAVMDWVYTADGLVVGFAHTPSGEVVHVDVLQFLVQGRKPHGLKGARPTQIHRTAAATMKPVAG